MGMPRIVHARLRPHCDICSCLFVPGDGYRALLGNEDSTSCEYITEMAIMPDYGISLERLHGRYVCRRPDCVQCLPSPETATVHWDCFRILETYNVPREILWTALAWRAPWRAAPALFLSQTSIPSSVYTTTDRLGIPLRRLPPELAYVIRDQSRHAKFWRYCMAAQLGLELSKVEQTVTKSVSLAALSGWERGSPWTTAECTMESAARLSIDARGIRTVERISADTDSATASGQQTRPSKTTVYITLQPKDIQHTTVHFQNGMLRIQMPAKTSISIRDTADPLYLPLSCVIMNHFLPVQIFHTINLRKTFGLTFLLSSLGVYSVHDHTSEQPSAMAAIEPLSTRQRLVLCCIFVPLPPGEEILALGIRSRRHDPSKPCFLIRTRLAGDIISGPYHETPYDLVKTTSPPDTLVYDTAELGCMSYLAAYQRGGEKMPASPGPTHPFDHRPSEVPFRDANYSSASLRGVVRARTFLRRDGHCCAILLDYGNGARRAVGDCWFGIDPVEIWSMPRYICVRKLTYTPSGTVAVLKAVQVHFSEREHQHAESYWTCHAMEGDLEFWFTSGQGDIRILS